MNHTQPFRVVALPVEPFVSLFDLDDADLAEHGARRLIADAKPGFPCRVSLEDAEVGERVILLPYEHHAVASPYRAAGPIFVREQAKHRTPGVNEVPESLRRRLLSVRAFDPDGMMIAADVTEGAELEGPIARFFADPRTAYLHVHNARPGCYACRIERV